MLAFSIEPTACSAKRNQPVVSGEVALKPGRLVCKAQQGTPRIEDLLNPDAAWSKVVHTLSNDRQDALRGHSLRGGRLQLVLQEKTRLWLLAESKRSS